MRPLTCSCFLLPLLGRLFLLALPFLLGICLPSPWSQPFPLHALAFVLLSLAHLDSLPPHDLILWTDGSVPFSFGKGGCGVLANYSLCSTEATLSFSAGQVCSSFSAETCAIQHALCWSRQHQQVCHFSSLLLLSDSRFVLFLLLFYQTTMGPRTLVSPGKAADELARQGTLLAPSAIPCSLSPLISCIHSSFLGLEAYCLI